VHGSLANTNHHGSLADTSRRTFRSPTMVSKPYDHNPQAENGTRQATITEIK
jgi:hypothetical protein